jgi:hypothetical protein
MKPKKVSGTVKTQWGTTLPETVSYNGSVTVYEKYEEVTAANDLPNNDEVVRFKNAQRVANKRQKLVGESLAAKAEEFAKANPGVVNPYIEPTTENSPKVRWTNIFDSVVAHSGDREKAALIATAALDGYTPDDFDVDAE